MVTFFIDWELWQQMTFVLACSIVIVFTIGLVKLALMNRIMRKREVLDLEKRQRLMDMRRTGLETKKGDEIPFGVRAIQSGIEIDGIWISRPTSPAALPRMSSSPIFQLADAAASHKTIDLGACPRSGRLSPAPRGLLSAQFLTTDGSALSAPRNPSRHSLHDVEAQGSSRAALETHGAPRPLSTRINSYCSNVSDHSDGLHPPPRNSPLRVAMPARTDYSAVPQHSPGPEAADPFSNAVTPSHLTQRPAGQGPDYGSLSRSSRESPRNI